MAKDKGKKTAAKSVTDDDFAKPSEAPAGGDGWSLTDGDKPKSGSNDGELFLITPLREEEHADTFSKSGGMKKHIVCDVVHLNEKKPAKSVEHEDIWVFGGWVMGALRAYIGERRVLGRLVKTADKTSATGYVWKLEDADADDVAVAREYLASLDPFATKKTKPEPEADAKPAKKSKKAEPEPPAKKSKKSKK